MVLKPRNTDSSYWLTNEEHSESKRPKSGVHLFIYFCLVSCARFVNIYFELFNVNDTIVITPCNVITLLTK